MAKVLLWVNDLYWTHVYRDESSLIKHQNQDAKSNHEMELLFYPEEN